MDANSWLLLTYRESRKLKNKTVWEQKNSKKKIKLLYLMYLTTNMSEQENVCVRTMWTRPIFSEEKRLLQGCGDNLFLELEEDITKFFNYFRMIPNMFYNLLNLIQTQIAKQHVIRIPIKPKIRLAITLRYLASGDSMSSIAYAFRVAPQTVSEIILETCTAIWDNLAKNMLKVPTVEDWNIIAQEFESLWNFPHCIGAIDGKHITIQAPPNSGSSNYNYKNNHSIILLAVADANMCFVLVDIGAPGRKSDSGVFRNSSIGNGFENKLLNLPDPSPVSNNDNIVLPYVLLGDEAFALTEYMMRPYPRSGPLNRRKKVFNYRLSRARRVVECAFGLLRGRWRIFAKPIIASDKTTIKIVQATICLHNYIIKRELSLANTDRNYSRMDYTTQASEGLVDIGRTGTNYHSRNAAKLRESFADYFETIGAVPWQWQKVEQNDF